MSFTLFLICMRNGEYATFKRALFEEVLGRQAIDPTLPFRLTKWITAMAVARKYAIPLREKKISKV